METCSKWNNDNGWHYVEFHKNTDGRIIAENEPDILNVIEVSFHINRIC